MIMAMNENFTEVVVEKVGARDQTFADFKEAMPHDEPRFAVYDLEFKKNGIDQSKLCFVMFIPDDCKAGVNKVAYAQAKDACKSKVQPTHKEFQINHPADLNEAEWIEDLS